MQDYYDVLEVEPTASFEQVKAAYRRKALRHHPDRGGSHSEMVSINEAWEVLSNADLRRQYDEQRKSGETDKAAFEEARKRSKNYERNWKKFDSWLSSISRDFNSAEFGSKTFLGMNMPTASNSISAWVFLITGGLIGFLIWLALFVSITQASIPQKDRSRSYDSPIGRIEKKDHSGTNPFFMRIVSLTCIASVAAGAWSGKWTHQKFGTQIAGWLPKEMPFSFFGGASAALAAGDTEPEPSEKSRCINCPKCDQRLRLPTSAKPLTITCPKCKTCFDFPEQMNHQGSNKMKFPPNNSGLATLLRCLLIFEIVFTVISIGISVVSYSVGEQMLIEAGLVSPEVNMVAMAVFVVAAVVLLPMAIASWVGLFQHKNLGRWLYLASLAISLLMLVFVGCFSWSYVWDLVPALDAITKLTSGLIVSICFLSPLASEFESARKVEAT